MYGAFALGFALELRSEIIIHCNKGIVSNVHVDINHSSNEQPSMF